MGYRMALKEAGVADLRIGHRRRRIEWPSRDANIQDLFGDTTGGESLRHCEETERVVQYHPDRGDWRNGYMPDMHVGDEWYGRNRHWRALLRNLYWRARRQSCAYDIFELLRSRGLVDACGLAHSLEVKSCEAPQTMMIQYMIYSFQFPRDEENSALDGNIALQTMDWGCEETWLATMISRGGSDLREIFLTIEHSRMLGHVNEEGLSWWLNTYAPGPDQFPEISPISIDNPERELDDPNQRKKLYTYGFILPNGLGQFNHDSLPELLRPFRKHLEDIEATYIKEFAVPEGAIVLESQQHLYFEEHPDRLLGSENDIHDGEADWDTFPAASVTSEEEATG